MNPMVESVNHVKTYTRDWNRRRFQFHGSGFFKPKAGFRKNRNRGYSVCILASIHYIHSYSKYVTSCKYLGLPNPGNSGTLGTPAKTTMEPDNGHIGRRDFLLGSIISSVSRKLFGSTIGPSAIAWTSFGYCSLGFGLREQLRRPRTKIPEGLGFRVISPGVPEYHVQSTVASWWDYPSCKRTWSWKA